MQSIANTESPALLLNTTQLEVENNSVYGIRRKTKGPFLFGNRNSGAGLGLGDTMALWKKLLEADTTLQMR